MHLGALLALWPATFSWSGLVVAVVLYWVTGGLGITLCFHRLLTHASFKTYKPVKYFLAICGSLAWQGGVAQWVGTHRLHHKHSDDEHDPHSPQHGFTWSHILWCMHDEDPNMRGVDAAKDIHRDRGLYLIDKLFWVPQFLLIPALYCLGEFAYPALGGPVVGLSWVVWGVFVRTIAVYHATWFVNSATHTWGYRNFTTKDNSTNSWWVALLGFGEGWHNNHHAQQRSAAHGMRWYEFDITWVTIRAMKALGLAWNVVEPQPEKMDQHAAIPASPVAEEVSREDQQIATEMLARLSESAHAVSDAAHAAAHTAAVHAAAAGESAHEKTEAAREAIVEIFEQYKIRFVANPA